VQWALAEGPSVKSLQWLLGRLSLGLWGLFAVVAVSAVAVSAGWGRCLTGTAWAERVVDLGVVCRPATPHSGPEQPCVEFFVAVSDAPGTAEYRMVDAVVGASLGVCSVAFCGIGSIGEIRMKQPWCLQPARCDMYRIADMAAGGANLLAHSAKGQQPARSPNPRLGVREASQAAPAQQRSTVGCRQLAMQLR